ncbi:MAG: right-handed parallel beta-helix repeat-containing protein [Verrucomicrobiales bacterium]|nr:right-handed parallel beta-helix repeat-containing protein [Verrucomicrobiales bacterium]
MNAWIASDRKPEAAKRRLARWVRVPCLLLGVGTLTAFGQGRLCVDDDNLSGIEDGTARYPFRSVTAAIAAASDGVELAVAAGEYAGFSVVDHWYVFRGGYFGGTAAEYASGGAGGDFATRDPEVHVTVLRGTPTQPVIALDYDASGTVIEGFHITGGLQGIRLDGWPGSADVTIRGNLIEDNGELVETRDLMGGGIGVLEGSNILIEGNVIRGNRSGLAGGIGTSMEGTGLVIRGNVIEDNEAGSDHGGGLFVGGQGVIENNVIQRNSVGMLTGYGWGGGAIVVGEGTDFVVSGNVILGNFAPSYAGGLYLDEGAHARLIGNVIAHNRCEGLFGAGIGVDGANQSRLELVNCTVAFNTGGSEGGNGLFVEAEADAFVTNCIFWGNSGGPVGTDFHVAEPASASIQARFTLSAEPIAGEGNFQVDPAFADPDGDDFHLRSTGGRWDSRAGLWVVDSSNSYGIDAGDPLSGSDLEPVPNGGRVNLGAYGNTPQASKTPVTPEVPGAPGDVSATDGDPRLPGRVRITWAAVPGPVTYTVERSPVGAVEGSVIASGLTVLVHEDVGVTGTHRYRVRAETSLVTGPWSEPDEGHAYVEPVSGPRSIVLQQGYAGTTTAVDTWISDADWGSPPGRLLNHGRDPTLFASDRGTDKPLFRFDLSAIPPHSRIDAAELRLFNLLDTGGWQRRFNLHSVRRSWSDGNQVNDPVDAPGDYGATGVLSFQDASNPTLNQPWDAIGMQAGTDYDDAPLDGVGVRDSGWYAWELTSAVRGWVRGETANEGVVLIDATGWEEANPYYREFASAEHPDEERRPALYVTYNPDVPFVDAGPDGEDLAWGGSAVTLDGSASHDRPGGDDTSLQYEWRIVQPAFGSAMSGVIGTHATETFLPDRPGEWVLELTVRNGLDQAASDQVRWRLLSVPVDHPRIYLTAEQRATLAARASPDNPVWAALVEEAEASDGDMAACALVWQITGDPSDARAAVSRALAVLAGPEYPTKGGDLAVIYDWCHAALQPAERTAFLDYFAAAYETWRTSPDPDDVPGWGNYWPRYSYSLALMGLATHGELPGAVAMMDAFRRDRYGDIDLPLLERIADGGAWPEGFVYDSIANRPRLKTIEAWRTATGEDLFASSPWYRERLGFFLMNRLPGVAWNWSYAFHPYEGDGDSERGRGSIVNYRRIMALILLSRFPDDPAARQLQALLATGPTAGSMGFLAHEEFLWFNPEQPADAPSQTTHFARGTGWINARSGWPSGAADTNAGLAVLTFRCGDHFSYHQHYDQNSITLFRGEPLLVDSGVYSQEGLSVHDQNYYVRTIAHNTLVVYHPDEDFSAARPDAYSNDGGQRTMYPASRAPLTIAYADEHAAQYHTGSIERYADLPGRLYVVGDATAAYNNPAYNQAMDGLTGNVAKVSRFEREVVYLRPTTPGGRECVVLCDRVGVTEPRFSGANTKLLFHALTEPVVEGAPVPVSAGETWYADASSAEVVGDAARLHLTFLSPGGQNVRKVGGRGVKSFWVFGENLDYHWDPAEPQPRPVNDFETEPYGEWRLELEPPDDALEHAFLTVLQPSGLTALPLPVSRIEGTGVCGVSVRDGARDRAVVFAREDRPGQLTHLAYETLPLGSAEHLIVDLVPDTAYALSATWQDAVLQVTLTADPEGAWQASGQGVLQLGDADGDGLFDAWEVAVGLNADLASGRDGADGDPDGDRLSNADEQRAGTHPLDPASRFALMPSTQAGETAVLRWTSAPGRRYRVERTSALGADDWIPVETRIEATPPVNTLTVPSPVGLLKSFYRVTVEEIHL